MKCNFLLVLLVVLLLFVSVRAQGGRRQPSSANSKLIGYIQKQHVVGTCGCRYYFRDNATRSIYSADSDNNAWMNIDGRDVKLNLVNSVSVPKGRIRKGQRVTRNYVASGIKVKVETTAGDYEGEGVRGYTVIITVTKGSLAQTVKIVGDCECEETAD